MPFNSHHWATPIFLILFNYLSLYLSINLSIFLPIHISITVSVYLSITISICQSINQYSIAADPGADIGLVFTGTHGAVGRCEKLWVERGEEVACTFDLLLGNLDKLAILPLENHNFTNLRTLQGWPLLEDHQKLWSLVVQGVKVISDCQCKSASQNFTMLWL